MNTRATLLALLAGLFVALPSLAQGFFLDDHAQTEAIQQASRPGTWLPGAAALDLYDFADGTLAGHVDALKRGKLVWWAEPALQLHFFRPLTSALRTADQLLFGARPLGYHVHSVLWYLALIGAAGVFLRRVLPGPTGALALLLFAICGAHATTVTWIAARHAMVAAVPSILGLAAYVRDREEGFRPGRWWAALGIGVGLLGSETALGAVAYVIAYEILAAPTRTAARERRFVPALPTLGLVLAYLLLYKSQGYGTRGGGEYLDPLTDPLLFARGLALRVPILLGELLGGLSSDGANVAAPAKFVAVGVLVSVVFALLLRAILPRLSAVEARALRWLLPGALLALLASAGGVSSSRLLMMPSLGSAALVAVVLRFCWSGVQGSMGPRAWVRRAGFLGCALVHVGLALLMFAVIPTGLNHIDSRLGEIARAAELRSDPEQDVFVLAGDWLSGSAATVSMRELNLAKSAQILSLVRRPQELTRTSATSFRLRVNEGRYLENEKTVRSPRTPMRVGDRADIHRATVVVTEADAAGPSEFEVTVDSSLDDPSLTFLAWHEGRLRRVAMPEVSGSRVLPWEPGPMDRN